MQQIQQNILEKIRKEHQTHTQISCKKMHLTVWITIRNRPKTTTAAAAAASAQSTTTKDMYVRGNW